MKFSHSRIQCYKSCRRLYFLKYVEGLVSTKEIEPLERGKRYHEGVDALNRNETVEIENPKHRAMVSAYEKYVMPKFKITNSEEWFEFPLGEHTICGRIDGQLADGTLVEHKTVSSPIDEEYMYQLNFDEQVLTYMLAKNVNEMWYTVCQTPTIRQKKNETDEEFYQRCVEWYDTATETRIGAVLIQREHKQIAEHKTALEGIVDEMSECSLFYRNTGYCNKWGRFCEYSNICLDYSKDKNYVGFERRVK